jgi:hypothetical protein
MSSPKSGIVLSENETLLLEVEAGLYGTSSFLPLGIILEILRLIAQIVGIKKRGYLVVTNKRLVEVYQQFFLWILPGRKKIRYFNLKLLSGIGYNRKGTFAFLFRAWHLFYYRNWLRIYAVLKGLDEGEAQKAATILYNAVSLAS